MAMPLGQHNLLASWLVILLPLALLTAREPGIWRWLGLAGGILPAVTILATLSLAGNLALAAEALIALVWIVRRRRSWAWGLIPLVLVAGLGLWSQRARIASIVAGQDLSMRGRAVYYEGALEGFRARPVLGWGPGSAAWTAAAFFDPVPGVSPVGESVGELHSLPLHLAYELGAVGLIVALALGAAFLARRISEMGQDPLRFAGLVGLCGAAVASLGSAALAVTALPVARGGRQGLPWARRPRRLAGCRSVLYRPGRGRGPGSSPGRPVGLASGRSWPRPSGWTPDSRSTGCGWRCSGRTRSWPWARRGTPAGSAPSGPWPASWAETAERPGDRLRACDPVQPLPAVLPDDPRSRGGGGVPPRRPRAARRAPPGRGHVLGGAPRPAGPHRQRPAEVAGGRPGLEGGAGAGGSRRPAERRGPTARLGLEIDTDPPRRSPSTPSAAALSRGMAARPGPPGSPSRGSICRPRPPSPGRRST